MTMGFTNDYPSEDFMSEVANSYGHYYDDRKSNNDGYPTLSEVAMVHKTTVVRVRKILITKGMYSTETTRTAIMLRKEGHSIDEIGQIMGLKPAAVKAALPYEKGIYSIDPKTELGERVDRSRRRRDAVERLSSFLACNDYCYPCIMDEDNVALEKLLWECIVLFQDYPFKTSGRSGKGAVSFRYVLKRSERTGELTDELVINREIEAKTITRAVVEMAFANAIKEQETSGCVKGPRKLGVVGARYLYGMFLRFGVITGE